MYKLTGDATARTSDYHQLLAYTTALDLPEGVLIYRITDRGAEHGMVTVHLAGNTLHTKGVNLTGTSTDVAAVIESLADRIADRA